MIGSVSNFRSVCHEARFSMVCMVFTRCRSGADGLFMAVGMVGTLFFERQYHFLPVGLGGRLVFDLVVQA